MSGLTNSSPILARGMENLTPAFSFMLNIFLRKAKVDWRSSSTPAYSIGTLVSVLGALVITLYKGPLVKADSYLHHQLRPVHHLYVFSSAPNHWVRGAILLVAASFSVSVWNVVQVRTVKECPEVMKIVSLCSLFGTIQSAIVSVVAEGDSGAWNIKLNLELLAIILSALFGSVVRLHVHTWCMRVKGPLYVLMFKPLGIVTSIISTVFFGDTLHLGRSIYNWNGVLYSVMGTNRRSNMRRGTRRKRNCYRREGSSLARGNASINSNNLKRGIQLTRIRGIHSPELQLDVEKCDLNVSVYIK